MTNEVGCVLPRNNGCEVSLKGQKSRNSKKERYSTMSGMQEAYEPRDMTFAGRAAASRRKMMVRMKNTGAEKALKKAQSAERVAGKKNSNVAKEFANICSYVHEYVHMQGRARNTRLELGVCKERTLTAQLNLQASEAKENEAVDEFEKAEQRRQEIVQVIKILKLTLNHATDAEAVTSPPRDLIW